MLENRDAGSLGDESAIAILVVLTVSLSLLLCFLFNTNTILNFAF